jgi:hypothetical protein
MPTASGEPTQSVSSPEGCSGAPTGLADGRGVLFGKEEMPFIQVDLEAITNAEAAAPLAGATASQVLGGLVRMWSWCWHEKRTMIQKLQVDAFIGGTRAAEALEAFGFLERANPAVDIWRVRGAERYLRLRESIEEGRRKGGVASKGNLKQFSRRSAGGQPEVSRVDQPAETGSLHRSSNIEHIEASKTPIVPVPVIEPEVQEVFSYYRERMGGGGPEKPGKAQASHIRARLRENRSVGELKAVVDGALFDIKRWPERISHLGIGVLFRDDDHVRKFMLLAEVGPPKPQSARGSDTL